MQNVFLKKKKIESVFNVHKETINGLDFFVLDDINGNSVWVQKEKIDLDIVVPFTSSECVVHFYERNKKGKQFKNFFVLEFSIDGNFSVINLIDTTYRSIRGFLFSFLVHVPFRGKTSFFCRTIEEFLPLNVFYQKISDLKEDKLISYDLNEIAEKVKSFRPDEAFIIKNLLKMGKRAFDLDEPLEIQKKIWYNSSKFVNIVSMKKVFNFCVFKGLLNI